MRVASKINDTEEGVELDMTPLVVQRRTTRC